MTKPKGKFPERIAQPVPPNATILKAKDMSPLELYQTVQSPDPKKQFVARMIGIDVKGVKIQAYYPELRAWREVVVQHDYKVIVYPKVTVAKGVRRTRDRREVDKVRDRLASRPVRPTDYGRKAPQALGKNTGKSVYECWGAAFANFGRAEDAPTKIVNFMRSEFPEKKTMWEKWVNVVRPEYNNGKLPGVPRPTVPLKPYKIDIPKEQLTSKRDKLKLQPKEASPNGLQSGSNKHVVRNTKIKNKNVPVQTGRSKRNANVHSSKRKKPTNNKANAGRPDKRAEETPSVQGAQLPGQTEASV